MITEEKDTPVSLDAFKAYTELSKLKFRAQSAVNSDQYSCAKITLNCPLSPDITYSFGIKGITTEEDGGSILDFITFSVDSSDEWSGAALSYGSTDLQSGAIQNEGDEDEKCLVLYLNYGDSCTIQSLSVDAIAFNSEEDKLKALNRVKEITFIQNLPADPDITIGNDEEDQIQIKSLQSAVAPTFSITNASGASIDYISGQIFNSIQEAGKLSHNVSFKLKGDITSEEVSVDFGTANDNDTVELNTSLDEGVVTNLTTEVSNTVLDNIRGYLPAQATDSALGTIKLYGSDRSPSSSLSYKVQLDDEGRAYVTVPPQSQLDVLYLNELLSEYDESPGIEEGQYVIYTGETTEDYINGGTYQAAHVTSVSSNSYFCSEYRDMNDSVEVDDVSFKTILDSALGRFPKYSSTTMPINRFLPGSYIWRIPGDVPSAAASQFDANQLESGDLKNLMTFNRITKLYISCRVSTKVYVDWEEVSTPTTYSAGTGIKITEGEISVTGYEEDEDSLTFTKSITYSGDVTCGANVVQSRSTKYNIQEVEIDDTQSPPQATVSLGNSAYSRIDISDNITDLNIYFQEATTQEKVSKESILVSNSSGGSVNLTYGPPGTTLCAGTLPTTISDGTVLKLEVEIIPGENDNSYLINYTVFA